MTTRAIPPNPARASGRRNPNCVSRVLFSSSARLLKSGGSTIGGLCGEPGRFVSNDSLNVFVHSRDQALQDSTELFKHWSSPAGNAAWGCRMGEVLPAGSLVSNPPFSLTTTKLVDGTPHVVSRKG